MQIEDRALSVFRKLADRPEEDIDLGRAALSIGLDVYPDMDIEEQSSRFDSLTNEIREHLPESRDPQETLETICTYLFALCGFHGNTEEYYDPRNSYLNDVLDRRSGIPISLSIIVMEVARRCGFPLFGVSMPGHFLSKYEDFRTEFFIDAFNSGAILSRERCAQQFRRVLGETATFDPVYLEPSTKRSTLVRMLNNLKNVYAHRSDFEMALRMTEKILTLAPDDASEIRDRGFLWMKQGDLWKAVMDLEDYLERWPDAPDANYVKEQSNAIRKRLQSPGGGDAEEDAGY